MPFLKLVAEATIPSKRYVIKAAQYALITVARSIF